MSGANDSAYPLAWQDAFHYYNTPGLTKREAFAMAAMQGMLAYAGDQMSGSHHTNNTPAGVAVMAVEYADAMLAELAKTQP